MDILQITVFFVVSTGFGDGQFYREVMVVASMYPASRIVVKPINCEYNNILDMLLLRILKYDFCKCCVMLEHRYVYIQSILNRTIIANIEDKFQTNAMR